MSPWAWGPRAQGVEGQRRASYTYHTEELKYEILGIIGQKRQRVTSDVEE